MDAFLAEFGSKSFDDLCAGSAGAGAQKEVKASAGAGKAAKKEVKAPAGAGEAANKEVKAPKAVAKPSSAPAAAPNMPDPRLAPPEPDKPPWRKRKAPEVPPPTFFLPVSPDQLPPPPAAPAVSEAAAPAPAATPTTSAQLPPPPAPPPPPAATAPAAHVNEAAEPAPDLQTEDSVRARAVALYRAAEQCIRQAAAEDANTNPAAAEFGYTMAEASMARQNSIKWRDRGPRGPDAPMFFKGQKWREGSQRFSSRGGKNRDWYAAQPPSFFRNQPGAGSSSASSSHAGGKGKGKDKGDKQ